MAFVMKDVAHGCALCIIALLLRKKKKKKGKQGKGKGICSKTLSSNDNRRVLGNSITSSGSIGRKQMLHPYFLFFPQVVGVAMKVWDVGESGLARIDGPAGNDGIRNEQ